MPAVPRRPASHAEMYQVSTDCFGRSPPPQHGSHASQSLRLCKVRGSLVRRAGLKDDAAKQRPNRWVDLSRQRDSMVNAIASLFAERTATFALVTLKSRRSIVRRAPMNRCAQTCFYGFSRLSRHVNESLSSIHPTCTPCSLEACYVSVKVFGPPLPPWLLRGVVSHLSPTIVGRAGQLSEAISDLSGVIEKDAAHIEARCGPHPDGAAASSWVLSWHAA
jgi:hypothetical protein